MRVDGSSVHMRNALYEVAFGLGERVVDDGDGSKRAEGWFEFGGGEDVEVHGGSPKQGPCRSRISRDFARKADGTSPFREADTFRGRPLSAPSAGDRPVRDPPVSGERAALEVAPPGVAPEDPHRPLGVDIEVYVFDVGRLG